MKAAGIGPSTPLVVPASVTPALCPTAPGEDREPAGCWPGMKRIGFLSFGHWTPSPHSQARSASDVLLQSIDLAVAAEELGADGAYFRVHHFARQLSSPFPLLAAIGARTSRIEIGTARDRHALREPALHGRGRRRGRPDLGRATAAGDQPGITRAGHRRLPLLRLHPGRGRPTPPTWPASTPGCSSTCSRARASPSRTRARCSPTRPGCCGSSRTRRACASGSGGAPAAARRPSGRPSRA